MVKGFLCVFCVLLGVNSVTVGALPSSVQSSLTPRSQFIYSGQVDEEPDWVEDDWNFARSRNDEMSDLFTNWIQINQHCSVDDNFGTLTCIGIHSKLDLPQFQQKFLNIRHAIFVNLTTNPSLVLGVQDLHSLFRNIESLSLIGSPRVTQRFLRDIWMQQPLTNSGNSSIPVAGNSNHKGSVVWPSVRKLDFTGNELNSKHFPFTLNKVFPNLSVLILQKNNIMTFPNVPELTHNRLKFIDISENPLDCTSPDLEWVDHPNLTLINLENTFCEKPPHQNKPKPILQTIRIVKKVKSECRVNCTCVIDYIWEQDKGIHSKTAVNCSNRGFFDFPDPQHLPNPTDTLYLNSNEIHSIDKFVRTYDDVGYVGIRNLYLENNAIANINLLETSDWIYSFQVLSLRNNRITDIPIHMLENIIRENKRLYLMDLSLNNWKCDCRTVSTFKVWLLRHAKIVKNIEDVRCERTKNQIRYLDNEDWCKQDEVSQMIELLDLFSIFLGTCIILVILKVTYDYWNFKRNGKVPWIVKKM